MSEYVLETKGLTRRFGGLVAVDNVDMCMKSGELVGLIGPNGAGKSTFFNCLTGFYPPSEGEVRFMGKPITGLKPYQVAKLGIGRTFQNLRIMPNMTVFDNVSIGAIGSVGHSLRRAVWPMRCKADEEISQRTWDILKRVHLDSLAGELAANLSYGKRKYLEIARALATNPELLILDEPAAGLNEQETSELADFIGEMNSEGIPILLVEHDMGLVMGICHRVMVLALGKKIADDTPKAIQKHPEVLEAYLGGEECQY
ncbi:ABC transporter ATP-binding protein [Maridesulfovibrio sp.]|uniref:ABC transporter ATP-binding protein n=1 Tax=Maridesulfovibrio sp. TaxID=2795000 RepID=UPI0029C9EF4C|nr:ABC transporter ATP-binding protein [Maridesulfovibrio sp.]